MCLRICPSRNLVPAASYLFAIAIPCGSQCGCVAIQPDLPAEKLGLPFSVRGKGMPYCSKVFSFHLRPLISSMPTGAPCCSEIFASAASRLRQQQIARLLGGVLINANAAAAHFQHHRQQVDFEPIGAADILLVQDRVELLKQQQRIKRVGLGVWADIARRQPPDVLLRIDLLAPFGEARGLDSLPQQRLILAGQAVARRTARRGCRRTGSHRSWSRARRSPRAGRMAASPRHLPRAASRNHRFRYG